MGQKKFDLEKQLEVAEAETLTVRSDLKLALKRVEDLQAAIAGEIDSDNSDDNSDRYIAGIYIFYINPGKYNISLFTMKSYLDDIET